MGEGGWPHRKSSILSVDEVSAVGQHKDTNELTELIHH